MLTEIIIIYLFVFLTLVFRPILNCFKTDLVLLMLLVGGTGISSDESAFRLKTLL